MKYARENQLDVEIKISENETIRQEHVKFLQDAGLPADSYTAIVIDDNGKIKRLREWSL